MMNFRQMAASLVLSAASAFSVSSTSLGAGGGTAVAIVVSRDLPVNEMSSGDLRRLYKGTSIVAGGKRLIPLTYPKRSEERQGFDRAVLGMSPEQVALYWVDRKIRGQSGAPKSVDSTTVLLKVVSKVDGAVGFVEPSNVTPGVKVLVIDGKRPSDPGYPIRF